MLCRLVFLSDLANSHQAATSACLSTQQALCSDFRARASNYNHFLFFLQIDKELASGEYFLKESQKKRKRVEEIKVRPLCCLLVTSKYVSTILVWLLTEMCGFLSNR